MAIVKSADEIVQLFRAMANHVRAYLYNADALPVYKTTLFHNFYKLYKKVQEKISNIDDYELFLFLQKKCEELLNCMLFTHITFFGKGTRKNSFDYIKEAYKQVGVMSEEPDIECLYVALNKLFHLSLCEYINPDEIDGEKRIALPRYIRLFYSEGTCYKYIKFLLSIFKKVDSDFNEGVFTKLVKEEIERKLENIIKGVEEKLGIFEIGQKVIEILKKEKEILKENTKYIGDLGYCYCITTEILRKLKEKYGKDFPIDPNENSCLARLERIIKDAFPELRKYKIRDTYYLKGNTVKAVVIPEKLLE